MQLLLDAGIAVLAITMVLVAGLVDGSGASSAEFDSSGLHSEDSPLPDKFGTDVHLTKKERGILKKLECSMCQAIVYEMHVEVVKHSMTNKGWGSEVKVFDTMNAICFGLLQSYTLNLTAPSLERKDGDAEDDGFGAGGDVMRAMLVLKNGCQRWTEDFGGDTSGYIFKVVKEQPSGDPKAIAQDFCAERLNLCGKNKQERQAKAKSEERERYKERERRLREEDLEEAKRTKRDPLDNLPEESKVGLQRMLEKARDDPLHYMEINEKEKVLKARTELLCPVCQTVFEDVYAELMKRPKSMRRETDIFQLVETACEGGPDLSVPNYFGVVPPPLPPTWTDRVRPVLNKQSRRYVLGPFQKKAVLKRQKWRSLVEEGKHKPPPSKHFTEDMMMTLTCKDMLDPARMSEMLFEQMVACDRQGDEKKECAADLAAAEKVCKTSEGGACALQGLGVRMEL